MENKIKSDKEKEKTFLEALKKLSKKYPNDMEFGKNVRKLLNTKSV